VYIIGEVLKITVILCKDFLQVEWLSICLTPSAAQENSNVQPEIVAALLLKTYSVLSHMNQTKANTHHSVTHEPFFANARTYGLERTSQCQDL
jgi:hypothetical protein